MQVEYLNREWFFGQLDKRGHSLRDLAKHLKLDPSAVSRMFSGARKMRIDEAEKIARFLSVPVEDVMQNAGVDVGDRAITRLLLTTTIGVTGKMTKIDPRELPSAVIARAQAAIGLEHRGRAVAAQVLATKGPLSLWDDAVVLFTETSAIEPSAVGVLSIATLRDGSQVLCYLERARKTGEAIIRRANGEQTEVALLSAAPVLVVLP
jgi:hypothetical protein